MATVLTFKSPIGGIQAVTPSAVFADTAKNIAAGANQVCTLPRAGQCLVRATVVFTAIGSACVTLTPAFSSANTLATNPTYGDTLTTANIALAGTVWTFEAIAYRSDAAYFGLWQAGTLTGTYTIDYSFEWYPLT